MLRFLALTALVCQLTQAAPSLQEIQQPKLSPAPQLDKHRELLREAVLLHDRGDYDGAIARYQLILKENPDDIEAIYELGFTYFAKGEYQKSLEVAYKGAQYKSSALAGIYTLIGNDLDHLGQSEKAIKVYREGIAEFPAYGQLHYNLAITLLNVKRPDEAKKSLKESVKASPDHPSSHLALSQLYIKDDYKIPSLLAACRFLLLEPRSQRSASTLQAINQILQSNVRQGDKPNNITILLDAKTKTDEGDFSAIGTGLALVAASRHLEKNKSKTETVLFVEELSTLFQIMSESTEKSSGFAWEYYRPYFNELARRKLAETFGYYIQQSSGSEEVSKWLEQHEDRVRELLAWSRDYPWPRR